MARFRPRCTLFPPRVCSTQCNPLPLQPLSTPLDGDPLDPQTPPLDTPTPKPSRHGSVSAPVHPLPPSRTVDPTQAPYLLNHCLPRTIGSHWTCWHHY